MNPAGEKIVAGLADFLRKKSKFHNDFAPDIPTGILNHFGDGSEVSAVQMWKLPEDFEYEEIETFEDWHKGSFEAIGLPEDEET